MKSANYYPNKIMSLIATVAISSTPFAAAPWARAENHKAGHGAHVHGSATLTLALESPTKGILLLESPGDSIVGFEHVAKSAADKKKEDQALITLSEKPAELFAFDAAAKCVVQKTRTEVKREKEDEDGDHDHDAHGKHEAHGEHSEVEAEYAVACVGPLTGTTLNVTLGKAFPKVKALQVQVLRDKGQSSTKLKNAQGSVQL